MRAPEATPVQKSLTAFFRDTPFGLSGDFHEVQVPAGLSIQEIVDRLTKPWQQDYLRVILNDEYIAKADWPLTVPADSDVINLLLIPAGGGSGAGQVLKAIAVIAIIAVATFFAGPAGLGLSSGWAAAIGATAGLVASLALNALFPPPSASGVNLPSVSSASVSGLSQDAVYGFSAVNNSLQPYSCIKRIYGRRYIKPDFAIKPYIVSSGSTQYLYQAFCVGYGPLQIDDICIGETPIGNYSDVEYAVHESFVAGDTLKYINQDAWQDPYSLKLTKDTATTLESTDNAESLVLDFQFPQGLFWFNNSDGSYNAETVELSLKIRASGSTTWLTVPQLGGSIENASFGSGSQIVVTKKTQTPFFVTVTVPLATAGKYEILPVRTTEDRDSRETNKSYDAVYLSSIRSIRNVVPIAPTKPVTIIELRAKATEKFNGAISELSCIATSKLPVYDGSKWTTKATRNPAWCYLDVLRGTATKKVLQDARIMLGDMLDWASWCDATMPSNSSLARASCDLIISATSTQWDVLKKIAATGYASPTLAGTRYTVAIDRPQDLPVQVFTPRNMRDLEGTISYHEQPHALRVQYSPTDTADADEVVVFDDGYSADGSGDTTIATKYETLPLVGIGRYDQAWVMGRRALAQGRLRIEEWSFTVGTDNLICRRGSYVRFAHDLPLIGSGTARISAVSGQTITTDVAITLSGPSYCLIRTSTLGQLYFQVSSSSGCDIVLVGDLSDIQVGDLAVFGQEERVYQDCFVKSIRPAGKLSARLTLIPYAPGVYTADTEDIPAYSALLPGQTGGTAAGGSTGVASTPVTPGKVTSLHASVLVSYSGGAPKLSVSLSWQSPVSGNSVCYKVYHYWNNAWVHRLTTHDTSALAYSEYTFVDSAGKTVNMNGVAMTFAVVAVNSAGSALTPDLGSQVTVTPETSNPGAVETLKASSGVFAIQLEWTLETTGYDADHVEIWASTSNERSAAVQLAKVAIGTNKWQLTGITSSSIYYFWIRVVDGAGNKSDFYPSSAKAGVVGQPSTDPAYILDQLNKSIGLNQLADDAAQPIKSVGLLDGENKILALALKAFKDHASVAATAQVKVEKTERVTAEEAVAQTLEELTASVNGAVAAISKEATARADADSAAAETLDLVATEMGEKYAAVAAEAKAAVDSVGNVTAQYLLRVDANGKVAAVSLKSGDEASQMVFLADQMMFAKPDGTGAKAIITVGEINGQSVVGISGDLIIDGSIPSAKILELHASKLTAGSIETEKLAVSAVSAYTSSTRQFIWFYPPASNICTHTLPTLTFTSSGGTGAFCVITSNINWNTRALPSPNAESINMWGRLYVDGTAVDSFTFDAYLGQPTTSYRQGDAQYCGSWIVSGLSKGAHTAYIVVQYWVPDSNYAFGSGSYIRVDGQLTVMENKV